MSLLWSIWGHRMYNLLKDTNTFDSSYPEFLLDIHHKLPYQEGYERRTFHSFQRLTFNVLNNCLQLTNILLFKNNFCPVPHEMTVSLTKMFTKAVFADMTVDIN